MKHQRSEATILIVENSEITRKTLEHNLQRSGFSCLCAENGVEALDIMAAKPVDLVLSDQQMPRMDGITLLKQIKKEYVGTPFILLTAYGSINAAVVSIKQGADDYLEKPCKPEVLTATIRRSLGYRQLRESNLRLRKQLCERYCFQNIVTKSTTMIHVLKFAEKVAAAPDTTIVIYGESGTGKEVLARAVHYASSRLENAFVAVNCAGIPSSLFEGELFGHTKGSFTGADRDRDGKFSQAKGGTILLDEIGDMPLELQAKLLRVLEERAFEQIGSNRIEKADVRVIAATNHDLAKLVDSGKFREDLYHRINAFPITLPPLRQRQEDIPLLVKHFVSRFCGELGKIFSDVTPGSLAKIMDYSWPGNIRELKNCLERAVILSDDGLIRPDHLMIANINRAHDNKGMIDISIHEDDFSLDQLVDKALEKALALCDGNKSRAAELLKVDRKIFYRRDKKQPAAI